MSEARILVVDDEPKLVNLLYEVLTASGYTVLSARSGEKAIELIAKEQPDLVLLDIVLSKEVDGFDVSRRVRKFSDVPIIMLTAKVRESDLLRGFDVGADDYLTKPFSSKELLVRVQAVLKRASDSVSVTVEEEIICGTLHIDTSRRRVNVDGERVKLTRTEYKLLHVLATNRNRVMLHGQLLTAVWGPEYRDDIDYLRAYIRYLRRKLESDPANPQYIITHQVVGYMLECPEES
jgi:two-component system KDP operon response regulator KdpE